MPSQNFYAIVLSPQLFFCNEVGPSLMWLIGVMRDTQPQVVRARFLHQILSQRFFPQYLQVIQYIIYNLYMNTYNWSSDWKPALCHTRLGINYVHIAFIYVLLCFMLSHKYPGVDFTIQPASLNIIHLVSVEVQNFCLTKWNNINWTYHKMMKSHVCRYS